MNGPRVVCEGLQFPEGPVWHPDAGLLVTEIIGRRVTRVRDGALETVAETGGGPNGMAIGPDGALYVANNGGIALGWIAPDRAPGRIQRITLDGEVTDLATHDEHGPLHTPNDICFGPHGLLYFTDPCWDEGAEFEPRGRVYRGDREGNVELMASGLRFANGIAFDAARERLFVAETYASRILAYPWSPRGVAEPQPAFELRHGFPDGLCFDTVGRLYVAATAGRGVEVWEPDGSFGHLLLCGEDTLPTNCCIAPDGTLYVTDSAGGRVFAFDIGAEPLPLV